MIRLLNSHITRRALHASALGLVGAGLAGCWGGNSWHQKLTVTVSTPTGDVSGSSVSQIGISFPGDTWLAPGYAYAAGQTGEAVVVEVAPGKYLFALITDRQRLLAFRVFYDDYAEAQPSKAQATEIETSRKSAVLQPKHYPPLITFDDVTKPETVKLVDPDKFSDVFGAGYALKSIELEITDEAVTKDQVKKKIPWLSEESKLNDFWKSFLASGYAPNGSTEVRTLFVLGD